MGMFDGTVRSSDFTPLPATKASLDELRGDVEKLVVLAASYAREFDLATAELASARQELDAVRTARDNLDRQLALARREVLELDAQIKLCPRCGVQLAAEVAAEREGATE